MITTCETYTVEICIGGSYDDAVRLCREYCMAVGFCVTVQRAAYVYTGGMEDGVIVRCINYPRFPSSPDDLWIKAHDLADFLKAGLFQTSYSMIDRSKTMWVSTREDAK